MNDDYQNKAGAKIKDEAILFVFEVLRQPRFQLFLLLMSNITVKCSINKSNDEMI